MNPIRTVAQFNNHLAWCLSTFFSERLGTERRWAQSRGSRIASLMLGFNLISLMILFEKVTTIKLHTTAMMLILAGLMILVHIIADKQELHDLNSIQTYTPEYIHNIKIDSMVYIVTTLIMLVTVVCVFD